MDLKKEIEKIVEEIVVRTCSRFGASLSDLEPEDQEVAIKANDALLAFFDSHTRSVIPKKMTQTKEEENSDWFYGFGYNHAIDDMLAKLAPRGKEKAK